MPRSPAPIPVPWRLRVLAVVTPIALATAVGISFVPSSSVELGPPTTRGASSTRCVPTGPVDTVEHLNDFAQSVRNSPEFLGADVGADVSLQDGRRLWVFGDTLRTQDSRDYFVRNSMLVLTPGCAQVVLPSDRDATIPDRSDGVGYWPMSVIRFSRTGYDLVVVTAQRVRRLPGSGPFGFQGRGPAIAVFIVAPGQTPQLITVRDLGRDDTRTDSPAWGAAATVSGGWVYLYGTARPNREGVFGHSLRVARLRPEQLLDVSGWQYWDGRRWQRDPDRAKPLIDAAGGVSQTLSVFGKNGKWYVLSKRDEFLGSDLVVWTGANPTGPFSPTRLASIPSDPDSGELRYMPLAHPDLLPTATSVVVSYSRNNTSIEKVRKDPTLYRPRFLRVELPR